MMTDIALPMVSKTRRVAFYIVTGLFSSLFFVGIFFVLNPAFSSMSYGLWVMTGWFYPHTLDIHQLHNINMGFPMCLFLAALLLQLHKPEGKIAAMQMLFLFIICSAIIGLATSPIKRITLIDFLPFFTFLIIISLLHPGRRELLRFGRPSELELLALVGVAAVPVLLYIVHQLNLQLTAGDEHAEFMHYIAMVNSTYPILLAGLLASFKTPGWRIPAWAAGLYAIIFGLTSALFPEQTSSGGVLWGSLAVLWGLVFIGTAEWKRLKAK